MNLFLVTRITFESIRDDILNCWKDLGETLVIISGTETEAGEIESKDSKCPDTSSMGGDEMVLFSSRLRNMVTEVFAFIW